MRVAAVGLNLQAGERPATGAKPPPFPNRIGPQTADTSMAAQEGKPDPGARPG